MNEKLNNTEENVEEVPFDLFDQVVIDENKTESIEVLDLPSGTPTKKMEYSKKTIVINAEAYKKALQKMNSSYESQSSNN